jgi:hypothetical protein
MNVAPSKRKHALDRGRPRATGLTAIGLCIAALAAPAPAGAAHVRKAAVDLHLNSNTLENLSEEGVLSGPVEPAHFVFGNMRFPFDRGHLETGQHRHGRVHALGGVRFFRDDGRTLMLDSPSIVARKHTAALNMLVEGVPVRVAYVPKYEIAQGKRVQIDGFARFSQSGADLMAETFGSTYPHPETPLGTLRVDMRLRAPAAR